MGNRHPELGFRRDSFVAHKTNCNFSELAPAQALEQANAIIKPGNGAVGLTEDPSALKGWMVACPEVKHLVSLYETEAQTKTDMWTYNPLWGNSSCSKPFLANVKKLSMVLQGVGSSFQEESHDLFSLITTNITNPSSAELLQLHMKKGQRSFQEFAQHLRNNPTTFSQSRRIESTSSAKILLLQSHHGRS